jgi:ribosome-associated protein
MSAMPNSADHIEVNRRVRIPLSELRFAFSRSSGPGGQNVNKVSTRVSLLFDVSATTALTPRQRARVMENLATRINSEGVLRVVSSRHRTQAANRQAATERFAALLAGALAVPKPRIETRVPRAVVARRLREKARRSEAKRRRRYRPAQDD